MVMYDTVPPKCYFCGSDIYEGPIVELQWTETFVVNEGWFTTGMDWKKCRLAHVTCVEGEK